MNFMKMRTFFYKKLPLFIKNCPLLFIKNSMLQIVIYKKLNFWEEYTPLLDTPWRGARYLGRTCATSRLHMCDRLPQLWHLIFFHLQYVSEHDHTVPLFIDLQSNPPHPLLQLLLLLASNPDLRGAQIASSSQLQHVDGVRLLPHRHLFGDRNINPWFLIGCLMEHDLLTLRAILKIWNQLLKVINRPNRKRVHNLALANCGPTVAPCLLWTFCKYKNN